MKVILTGASGMVGQGVLRECLLDPGVERVLLLGRSPSGVTHEKVEEIVHRDLADLAPIADRLAGWDACLFCLGTSSVGMSEADYRRVTFDLTLALGRVLAERSPECVFIYVSGAGTDSTARGRTMWARVKGETENALLELPLRGAYMFRPGFIEPLHGIRSRTRLFNALYAVLRPLVPLVRWLAPSVVTSTERLGRAMIEVARHGSESRVLDVRDINAAAAKWSPGGGGEDAGVSARA